MTDQLPNIDERIDVVIAGAGVAGLEAAFALREFAGDRVNLTLLAPTDEFAYRPLAVGEPFSSGRVKRYSLAGLAAEAGAELVHDSLEAVDAAVRSVRAGSGARIDYDALLTAWWSEHKRYGTLSTRPVVVVVCQSWERAQENAARADRLMTGAVGHSGTPPQTWYHAGRDHIFFAAEEDIYHGSLRALALPDYPPRLREAFGQGSHAQPEIVWLLPPTMVGRPGARNHS